MNTAMVDKQVVQAGRYGSPVKADSSGKLPSRIEYLRSGYWPETSNKGELTMSLQDLYEFKENFDNGVGVPGGKEFGQLPIDFSHDDHKEAAAWITGFEVEDLDGINGILWANVTYTDAGEAALKGGRFKCFSPSFWPACLGYWHDPEDYSRTARNVAVGGGLTNIPFFKHLTTIMASNAGNSKDSKKNVNAHKENNVPTLDEVRIKDVASLTDDDKKVLADNRAELSAEEVTKFFPEEKKEAPKVEASQTNGLNEEDAKLLASLKSGEMKVVKAAEYDGLKDTVGKLEASVKAAEEKEVRAFVTAQAGLGKIKTDEIDNWTGLITANAALKDTLSKLPENKQLAGEIGKEDAKEVDASAEFSKRVDAKIEASKDSNGVPALNYSQAVVAVANEDAELAASREQEVRQ